MRKYNSELKKREKEKKLIIFCDDNDDELNDGDDNDEYGKSGKNEKSEKSEVENDKKN